MTLETIEKEALNLPLEERACLAEKLLSSLDTLSKAETEQLWLREAQWRTEEIDQGLVELVSAEELERRVQAV
jgi:primosomal protein N''